MVALMVSELTRYRWRRVVCRWAADARRFELALARVDLLSVVAATDGRGDVDEDRVTKIQGRDGVLRVRVSSYQCVPVGRDAWAERVANVRSESIVDCERIAGGDRRSDLGRACDG